MLDFSKGRSRSQSAPSTCGAKQGSAGAPRDARSKQHTLAMTVFSARLLLIPIATCNGLVSQLVPSLTDPSLSVIVIASLGIAAPPAKKMSSSSSPPTATPTDQRYARPTPS